LFGNNLHQRHSGPVAGNPNCQPEIQKNRWKSAEGPELSNVQLLFQKISSFFESSADVFKLQLKI
jgi:hypothetical protein